MTAVGAEADALARALAAAIAGLRGRIDGFDLAAEDGWLLSTCPAVPHPPFTALLAYDPAADGRLAAGLPALLATFDRRGVAPRLLLAHSVFPQTQSAARTLGLSATERIPGMVVTAAETVPAPETGADIGRVGPEGPDLEAFARVAAAGFGLPIETAAVICTPAVLSAPGVSFYLARTGAGPACCTVSMRTGDELGIYLVGTVPEQRRRGLAAAVVSRALADGFAAGAALAYLQSSTMGYGVYRALGFREVTQELRMSRPAAVSG